MKKKVKFFKNFYTHTNMASKYVPTYYLVIKYKKKFKFFKNFFKFDVVHPTFV